jgi:hypothetical protein
MPSLDDLLQGYNNFAGKYQIPVTYSCNKLPDGVAPFSKRKQVHDPNIAISFFDNDVNFNSFTYNPEKYIDELQNCIVISNDSTIYHDWPLEKKVEQLKRNRSYDVFLQKHGINIIPNVRYVIENPFSAPEDIKIAPWCFDGLPHHSVVAVGTHGSMITKYDKYYHYFGILQTIKHLYPSAILIYGTLPGWIHSAVRLKHPEVPIYHFNSWVHNTFERYKDHLQPYLDVQGGN